jgi:hypothetical protein
MSTKVSKEESCGGTEGSIGATGTATAVALFHDPGQGIKVGFLCGVRSGTNLGSLDFDSLNAVGQKDLCTKKEFMIVSSLVLSLGKALKTI